MGKYLISDEYLNIKSKEYLKIFFFTILHKFCNNDKWFLLGYNAIKLD